jgi:hypothetical protein
MNRGVPRHVLSKITYFFVAWNIFLSILVSDGSRDSVVGIATGYELDDRGVGVRVPVGQEFSVHSVQTGSGAHLASYPMGTGDSFPGGKAAGHEADHSPPTSSEVKKMWIHTSTPPHTFIA